MNTLEALAFGAVGYAGGLLVFVGPAWVLSLFERKREEKPETDEERLAALETFGNDFCEHLDKIARHACWREAGGPPSYIASPPSLRRWRQLAVRLKKERTSAASPGMSG